MTFAIIPQTLSISAMRSSGYKDSAHAIAELVDNAVQAGDGLAGPTEVELICVDRVPAEGDRRRIDRIGVYDNASGMNPEALRAALQFGNGSHLSPEQQAGIGKFGMGLPNSSISQCRRVDVWSWQGGQPFHSHLDVTAIEEGQMTEVPVPTPAPLPNEWLKLITSEIGPHGTLVVWSVLDRVTWKQSTALLRNAEFITGRIYRKFLDEKKARIRLAAYEEVGGKYVSALNRYVRPNDPLYLMPGTNTPAPYDTKPAFELLGEEEIDVEFAGRKHQVKIAASICIPEVRRAGGLRPIGQHARKNQGVSVVRAGREIELNKSFENSYDPRERWWGIEVSFEPSLDDVFGVTNNKQAATGFQKMNLQEDADAEGLSVREYRLLLEADRDPRMPMYVVSARIDSLLSTMRKKIERMRETERVEKTKLVDSESERVSTAAVRQRQKRVGETGASDRDEAAPAEARTAELEVKFEQDGISPAKAREIAVEYVNRKIKFRFEHADVAGSAFFDVSSTAGLIVVTLNTKHPAHEPLFAVLRTEGAPENPLLQKFLFLITAWARMEDEAPSKQQAGILDDIRQDWGRMARDFFEAAGE